MHPMGDGHVVMVSLSRNHHPITVEPGGSVLETMSCLEQPASGHSRKCMALQAFWHHQKLWFFVPRERAASDELCWDVLQMLIVS